MVRFVWPTVQYSTVCVLYEPSSANYHVCHVVEEWPHGQVGLANTSAAAHVALQEVAL